eukprot:5829622-Alexandrium_andersonii.AAC.1
MAAPAAIWTIAGEEDLMEHGKSCTLAFGRSTNVDAIVTLDSGKLDTGVSASTWKVFEARFRTETFMGHTRKFL